VGWILDGGGISRAGTLLAKPFTAAQRLRGQWRGVAVMGRPGWLSGRGVEIGPRGELPRSLGLPAGRLEKSPSSAKGGQKGLDPGRLAFRPATAA